LPSVYLEVLLVIGEADKKLYGYVAHAKTRRISAQASASAEGIRGSDRSDLESRCRSRGGLSAERGCAHRNQKGHNGDNV
jgi:hypothetical protein